MQQAEHALWDILWYNDYLSIDEETGDVSRLCFVNLLWNYASSHNHFTASELQEYINTMARWVDDFDVWRTEEHCIFMMLVGMFGNWGTSINSGWICESEALVKWLESNIANDFPTSKLQKIEE